MVTSLSNKLNSGRYSILTLVKIFGFLLLGSFLVNWLNTPLSRFIYYSIITIFFFKSTDKVLGFVLVFILFLNPLNLFNGIPYGWMFQLTTKVGINFKPVLMSVIFIKFLLHPHILKLKADLLFKYYIIFVVYFLFLIIWGLVFGHSAKSVYDLMLAFPALLLFIILPKLFDLDELYLFNKIIFIFCLIHTFISLVDIVSDGMVTNFLIFKMTNSDVFRNEELVRQTGGITLVFYSMVASLYYLASWRREFDARFLWIVMFSSCLYIFNSATRGWMIASSFFIIAYLVYYFRIVFLAKKFILVMLIFVSVLTLFMPDRIQQNLSAAFDRLSTVESVIEGDMTAEGTARRWNIRGPIVLTRFEESPVFGFGFSKINSEYYDGHVGNHSVLLLGGIVGLVIIWLSIFRIIAFLFNLERKGLYNHGIFVFGLALVAIMIIHSTSRIMVSFSIPSDVAIIMVMMFNIVNAHLQTGKLFSVDTRPKSSIK